MVTTVRRGAALDRSGTRLVLVGPEVEVLVRGLLGGEIVERCPTTLPGVGALALSPEDDAIAVGGDGGIELLGRSAGRVAAEGGCRAVVWPPDGPRALFTSEETTVVIDHQGRALWRRRPEAPDVQAAAFTADGRTLVAAQSRSVEIIAWSLDHNGRGAPA